MILTRFAPSPTGYLHLGHVFSAILTWDAGERCLLRIEDIDAGRCRPEYEDAILEDLRWLGFEWHGAVRRQSGHMGDYTTALDRLWALGVLYPCFCTRKDIQREIAAAGHAPHGAQPTYPRICRKLDAGEAARRIDSGDIYALRLDAAAAVQITGPLYFTETGGADGVNADGTNTEGRSILIDPFLIGDAVLARKDVAASYHLAVVADDALQDVTLVVRGEDLLPATHLHRLLQVLLGFPAPAYLHHRLLVDADGQRLSKRHDSLAVRALREAGRTPAEVRAMAWEG